MLPIKHLEYNRALSQEIVKHWRCNPLEKDFLKAYRISSNAMTWFEYQNEWYFLRYTPESETSEEKLSSELRFLNRLRQNGYPAVESVNTLGDKAYSKIETEWGNYFAACFKQLKGKTLSNQEPSVALARLWGESLGKLHELCRETEPTQSYNDLLEWAIKILNQTTITEKEREAALAEIDSVQMALSKLTKTSDNYGRIHYDFEADNLIYNQETNKISVLDFDDSHMHFLAQDIERALNSLSDEWVQEDLEANIALKDAFIEGYESVRPLPKEYHTHYEWFERYANVYGYVRILHALSQMPSESAAQSMSDWLPNLLKRLEFLKMQRSRFFASM